MSAAVIGCYRSRTHVVRLESCADPARDTQVGIVKTASGGPCNINVIDKIIICIISGSPHRIAAIRCHRVGEYFNSPAAGCVTNSNVVQHTDIYGNYVRGVSNSPAKISGYLATDCSCITGCKNSARRWSGRCRIQVTVRSPGHAYITDIIYAGIVASSV